MKKKKQGLASKEIKLTLSEYVISRCIEKNIKGMKALVFEIKK